jgi:hypothetical protein
VRGKPCRNRALVGAELCTSHLRRGGRGGAPTALTPEVADQITTSLRAGNYVQVACRAAGVSRQAYGDWMRRGVKEPGVYRDFRDRVEKALAESEVLHVARISQASKESWQASAWLLERQFPERWGRVSTRLRLEADPEPAAVPPAEADPFEEVDELAARRRTSA